MTDEECPNCGSPIVIKQGRWGEFKACSNYPKCKTIIKQNESSTFVFKIEMIKLEKVNKMEKIVNVIGAGLAGVEACHQLVKRGYKVRLV